MNWLMPNSFRNVIAVVDLLMRLDLCKIYYSLLAVAVAVAVAPVDNHPDYFVEFLVSDF